MQNQPISAERAVDLLVPVLPELARAETYPQWSDGSGEPRRGQRVTLYDAAGDILGATRDEHRAVLRVLLRVEGGDWDRPQTFDVAAGTLSPTFPVVLSLPDALGDVDSYRAAQLDAQRHELEDDAEPPLAVATPPAKWVPCSPSWLAANQGACATAPRWSDGQGDHSHTGGGEVVSHWHPAEASLPVPDLAVDFARSVAAGFVTPVDWDDCDPQPAPAREVADVPVQGDAL